MRYNIQPFGQDTFRVILSGGPTPVSRVLFERLGFRFWDFGCLGDRYMYI